MQWVCVCVYRVCMLCVYLCFESKTQKPYSNPNPLQATLIIWPFGANYISHLLWSQACNLFWILSRHHVCSICIESAAFYLQRHGKFRPWPHSYTISFMHTHTHLHTLSRRFYLSINTTLSKDCIQGNVWVYKNAIANLSWCYNIWNIIEIVATCALTKAGDLSRVYAASCPK